MSFKMLHLIPLLILMIVLVQLTFPLQAVGPDEVVKLGGILNGIDREAIRGHVEALSSYGSRVTGYNGSKMAADYIYEAFLNYGLTPIRQKYPVVVPIDHGASIEVLDGRGVVERTINAYTVWPNLIQTCIIPDNINFEGSLVYVEDGDLSDFNGMNVTDKIVLMEFNSGDNWINAAKLGAKAVIFIAPVETTYVEARKKFLKTPIYFPRLYVSAGDGEFLKELASSGDVRVRLRSNMRYERRWAENIIGIIKGSNEAHREDIIVVAAHYDTWSVIPRLAPGKDEATAIATLLEMARYFSVNRPRKTMWFVALSGHYQGLAGARWFTEEYWFGGNKIWFFIGLDFSTDSADVATLYRGHMYDFGGGGVILRWKWIKNRIFNIYIPSLEQERMREYKVQDGFTGFTYGWWASIPVPYMLDSEPFTIAHGIGLTIRTNGVWRLHWGHPLSFDVNFENLWPQVEVASAIIYGLANEELPFSELTKFSHPERYLFTAAGGDLAGFLTVEGRVRHFNLSVGWYTSFPNALVVAQRIDKSFSSYPFSTIIEISNESGRFTLIGISGYGYGHGYGIVDQWNFEAFHINEETGLIDYAPDYGQYGRMVVQFSYTVNAQPYRVTTVVFKCSSIVLFDVIDPIGLQPKLFFDPRFKDAMHSWSPSAVIGTAGWATIGGTGQAITLRGRWSFTVYDFDTISEYVTWGEYSVGYEDVAMIFVPPNTRFMVLYRTTQITGILLNADERRPEGRGFLAKPGEELRIAYTAYRFVKDLSYIVQDRYSRLRGSFLQNPVAERNIREMTKYLRRAEAALSSLKYDEAYAELILAWGWAVQSYNETMRVIFDAVNINIIFFSFFLIFIFFFEKVIFESSGAKRWIIIASLFTILLAAYWYLHPAPKIAVNPTMGPLSVMMLMLFIFVSALLLDRMKRIIREEKLRIMGKHYVERATIPLAIMSFSYATGNMRRRKLRTALVLSTVLVVTFALIAFTSISPTSEVKFAPLPELPATYEGILFKREMQLAPDNIFNPVIVDAIRAIDPDAIIAQRVWYYPQLVGTESVYQVISSDTGSTRITAILGLSPNELDIYRLAVKGNWFIDSSSMACILPSTIAEELDVDVGDYVQVGPLKLYVTGIFNPDFFNDIRDLDNYPITPVNPNMVQTLAAGRPVQGEQVRVPLSWGEVIIIPDKLAYDIGGYLASVSVISSNRTTLKEIGSTFSLILQGVRIYMSLDGKVSVPSPVGWFGVQGLTYVMAPLIIGAFTLFNTILTGVKERTREIFVYGSVGLSPRGVTLIFFAESLIYALTAGTLGYLLGIAINMILVGGGHLPPSFISNTSSLATMIALMISISSIILATVYPAYVASRMITPSLERKWRIPTKPMGDEWSIPLPFSTESDAEVNGLMRYLQEYFSAYTTESDQPFIVRDVKISEKEKMIKVIMRLLPLESGVNQELTISGHLPEKERRWFFTIHLKKLSGVREIWESVNYIIVDTVRKQMLLWRGLREEERLRYIKGLPREGTYGED